MSVNYRTFVIANPTAGAGSVGDDWQLIERLLRANLPELDFAFTEGPGHATLLAREAIRNGWEMIVSVGGDGTLNEVINGFFEPPEPKEHYEEHDGWIRPTDKSPDPINSEAVLGLMPMGTGGDFRRSLGLMGGIAETVEHLRGRHTRRVDVGKMGYLDHSGQLSSRYFINVASAGMGGLIDRYVNNSWKGWGGTTSFILGTLRAFVVWNNAEVEIRLDDTTEIRDKITNLVCANGQYFGGGMWIAPGAELDDGSFQVVLIGNLTKPQMVKILPRFYGGRHLESRKVTRYRAQTVAARCPNPEEDILLDLDGEQPGKLPATWTIHPGQLRVKL